MSIHLQIVKYEVLKAHVEYQVLVTDSRLQQAWSFKTRYSQIRALHLKLAPNSNFPPRRLFGNTRPAFVEERLLHLQQYFDGLPLEVLQSTAFIDFCTPEDRVFVLSARHALQAKQAEAARLQAHLAELQQITDEVSSKFACWSAAPPRSDSDSTRGRCSSVEEVQLPACTSPLPQGAVPAAPLKLSIEREWIQAQFNSLTSLPKREAATHCVTGLKSNTN